MAIFEEKMYGVECDRCKGIPEGGNTGYLLFVDQDEA